MPAQSAAANTDSNGKDIIGYYGDRGDGTSNWYVPVRIYAGGIDDGATALLKLEDAAHASGDAGVAMLAVRRDTAAVGSSADGDYSTLNVDASGRLRTLVTRDADDTLSMTANTAEADDLVVKASAGVLHSIVGYVASGENGWIQVHDATSQPSDTTVPDLSFYVPAADDPQPVNIPLPGHVCSTGITLAWSTTGPTLTSGAAKMFLTAHYE